VSDFEEISGGGGGGALQLRKEGRATSKLG